MSLQGGLTRYALKVSYKPNQSVTLRMKHEPNGSVRRGDSMQRRMALVKSGGLCWVSVNAAEKQLAEQVNSQPRLRGRRMY